MLGSATAYWLARVGVKVALLERTMAAYGATGRNGGFVTVGPAEAYPDAIKRLGHETARAILTLTLDNLALLRRVLAEEEIACAYREPGNLNIALSEAQYSGLARNVAALQADGCPATLLDRKQVQELIGTPLGEEIIGGKFIPELGLVHSARLIQGLMGAAQRHGAQLCATTVRWLSYDSAGVAVHTVHGTIHADAVVVAANAWTDEIIPGLAGLITPVRGQALAYAPLPPVFPMGMGASVTSTGEYWQQTLDGSIVLGGCRQEAPGQDVGVRVMQPTQEVQAALERVLPRLFPALAGLQVAQRWAGLMAFTPDYVPIADRVQDMPGVWAVGGFCGHGMPFGMRLGQLLAEAITQGTAPAALAPFRLDRPTLRA